MSFEVIPDSEEKITKYFFTLTFDSEMSSDGFQDIETDRDPTSVKLKPFGTFGTSTKMSRILLNKHICWH